MASGRDAGGTPLEQASGRHARIREAALEAFGEAYERENMGIAAKDPGEDVGPQYVVAATSDTELVVIAGVWAAEGRTLGRLVARRDLLELLLEDPQTTAAWHDVDDGAGFALTGYPIDVLGDDMLLVVARAAHAVGETAGVTDLRFDEERLADTSWTIEALEAFLDEHDGDAIVLPSSILAELGQLVSDTEAF